jgi:hypothetical protein
LIRANPEHQEHLNEEEGYFLESDIYGEDQKGKDYGKLIDFEDDEADEARKHLVLLKRNKEKGDQSEG